MTEEMRQTAETHHVEWVVAEVIRRLDRLGQLPPAPPAESVEVSRIPHQLVIDDRLVTLATLDGRLGEVRRLVVPQGAIVTPAVKDELRDRGVALEFQSGQKLAADRPGLIIGRCTRTSVAVRAAAQLADPAGAVVKSFSDLEVAVESMVAAIGPDCQTGVFLTDHAWSAVCQANRAPHVRAAFVRSSDDVREAIRDIRSNLLVVDPRKVNSEQWMDMLVWFSNP